MPANPQPAQQSTGVPPNIKTTFFADPLLIGLHELSAGRPGVWIDYDLLETTVLKNLGLDLMGWGKQPKTQRPLVRVVLGAALSKLKHRKQIENGHKKAALTDEGIKQANQAINRILSGAEAASSDQEAPVVVKEPELIPNTALAPGEVEKKKNEIQEKIRTGGMISLAGITVPVNQQVPAAACLPLPACYQFPTKGSIATQIKETVIAFKNKRSTYIWGLPGSGKDAFVHAYSHFTKTPAQIFTISPNEDIQSWFFIRSFAKDGTSWEEGELLKAARDGYRAPDGSQHPYLILISDLDRATKNQAEALRLVMDSIEGRIMGPNGVKYKVFPGTHIVATANTSGGGDARGRCVSANVLDASILDRFERKFNFNTLEWADEMEILKIKFPLFDMVLGHLWDQVGQAVTSLRQNSNDSDQIFAEFGHRSVCSWIGHTQDILETEHHSTSSFTKEQIGDLLRRGATVLFDAMPDSETRLQVQRLIDPFLLGGAFPKPQKKK